MSPTQQPENQPLAARVARWLLSRPTASALFLLTLLLGSLATLPWLSIEAGLDPFFPPDIPQRRLLDRLEQRFTSDETLLIAYQTDDPFSYEQLATLRWIGERLEDIRVATEEGKQDLVAVDKVTSLATVKDVLGGELTFRAVPLVPDPLPDDKAVLEQIRRRALANPLVRDGLLGDKPQVAALLARLQLGLTDAQSAATVAAARDILRQAAEKHPGNSYHLTGRPAIEADTASYQAADLARFIPLVYAVIIVLLFIFVRRLRSILITLAAVTIALLGSLAALTLIGGSINNCTVMLPPVMAALTVAMMLHYFSELSKHAARLPHREAVEQTIRQLLPPSLIAALTTSIGFAALAISHVPAVRQLGLSAGAGMLMAFGTTATLFVLAARRWEPDALVDPRGVARARGYDGALASLGRRVSKRHRLVLLLSAIALAVVAVGISRVEVDMRGIEFFDREAPVRRAHDFFQDHLTGAESFVVAIRAPNPNRFNDPQLLGRLEQLEQFLHRQLGADQVTSVVDFLKLMHREFMAGEAEYWRIPDTEEQVAQLLLLNGDETLDEYLDEQRQWVRVVGQVRITSAQEMGRRYERLERYLAGLFPPAEGYSVYATGRSRLGADLTLELVHSQIRSILLSVVLIFALMFALFRSLRTGLMAVLPNVLPVATSLGLMGWVGIQLDPATAMISTVALGIAVDDTVHFLQQYRASLRAGRDPPQAVLETLKIKGPAIVWTSVVITLGFSVMLFSTFLGSRNFAVLICAAMITALLGDMLMLPALLTAMKSRLGLAAGPAMAPGSANDDQPSDLDPPAGPRDDAAYGAAP